MRSRPRILSCSWHCYLDPSSGAAQSLRDLLELLAARGWGCRALCAAHLDYEQPPPLTDLFADYRLAPRVADRAPPGGPPYSLFDFEQRGVDVTVYAPAAVPSHDAITPEEAAPLLALYDAALGEFRPDVVLTYGGHWLGRGIIARAKRRGRKVVFWLRNTAYTHADLFRAVDGILVPSGHTREHYRCTLGLDCTALASPLDWGKFFCGEGADGRHVTFVTPQPAKGLFLFARIAHELSRRRPDIPLLVVQGRAAASWSEDTGVDLSGCNLRRMGSTADPHEFYRASRLVLVPSLWDEPSSRVAAEALANGIPVLASRRGGLPETLAHAGFLFDVPAKYTAASREVPAAEEMAPWLDTILRLYDDEAFYQEQRRRCREAARAWRPEGLGDCYEAFLRGLMGKGGKSCDPRRVTKLPTRKPQTVGERRPRPAATPAAPRGGVLPAKASAAPAAGNVNLDVGDLFRLYLDGKHGELCAAFLRVLQFFGTQTYITLDDPSRASLLRFLKVFLTLFTQPDFRIPEEHVVPFLRQNYLLSNLAAMTPFRTTDGFLELLRYEPANFVKILTLYSARNTLRFDRRVFFDADPRLASLWYNCFCTAYKTGFVRDDVGRHLAEHYAFHDERMTLVADVQEPYFGSTYLDGAIDREIKPRLNEAVRRSLGNLKCDNKPDPKKIAVISDLWFPEHSVYRNYAAYVKELARKFHLTFFHVLKAKEQLDVSMFHEVRRLEWDGSKLNLDPLRRNDFMVVYYPDVGMTLPSIVLANHRIAPIQVASPGHSVSTWGADVDYFISGRDVEVRQAPERNYSERLVLLPGMGVIHNRPLYEPKGRKKSVPEFVLNCPWSGQKINARFLRALRRLIERSPRPLRFRLFSGGGACDQNGYLPFSDDVRAALGDGAVVELFRQLSYADYMGLMEEGDLTLDSFHFAGCNTVADSLFLHKPTVAWEGDKWYNRIGPQMLRLAGLGEWAAPNEDEYLDKALRLIGDDRRREEVTAHLRATDLTATVFGTADAPSFPRAVAYLIAHHKRLQRDRSRKPVVIR